MQWSQIFIKDGLNDGEGLELDELNYSGSSRKQQLPQLQPQCALGDTPATSHQLLMSAKANASPTSTPPTPPEEGHRMEKNGDPVKEAQGNPAPVVALRNGKTQTSLKTMSKRKISQHKEKKATQMLAIVLGKSAPLSLLRLKKPRFVAIINYRLNMQMRQFQIASIPWNILIYTICFFFDSPQAASFSSRHGSSLTCMCFSLSIILSQKRVWKPGKAWCNKRQ